MSWAKTCFSSKVPGSQVCYLFPDYVSRFYKQVPKYWSRENIDVSVFCRGDLYRLMRNSWRSTARSCPEDRVLVSHHLDILRKLEGMNSESPYSLLCHMRCLLYYRAPQRAHSMWSWEVNSFLNALGNSQFITRFLWWILWVACVLNGSCLIQHRFAWDEVTFRRREEEVSFVIRGSVGKMSSEVSGISKGATLWIRCDWVRGRIIRIEKEHICEAPSLKTW